MDQSRARSRKISHRQAISRLRSFRPADAAFVLHLTRCERCRDLTDRLLSPQETLAGLIFSLVLQASMLIAPQGHLPQTELQNFLQSLREDQTEGVRHLLTCERCRKAADKALSPHDLPSSDEAATIFTAQATPQ